MICRSRMESWVANIARRERPAPAFCHISASPKYTRAHTSETIMTYQHAQPIPHTSADITADRLDALRNLIPTAHS